MHRPQHFSVGVFLESGDVLMILHFSSTGYSASIFQFYHELITSILRPLFQKVSLIAVKIEYLVELLSCLRVVLKLMHKCQVGLLNLTQI